MSYPTIGEPAPDFELPDQNGDMVKLSFFKGKNVVVYFYPKALTPGCTVQACGIRDSKNALDKRDVVVLGISTDAVKRLPKFIEKENLNFTLLSDEDHAVAERYGVWGMKKFMGREFMGLIRTTFIIGKDGRLLGVMDKFKTKTHHEDLIAILDELLEQ
ncbi:MAG: thioredoxin-dependent thiol peroxidase [Porticoccaceae bacterium]